jgi:hypothetical protein
VRIKTRKRLEQKHLKARDNVEYLGVKGYNTPVHAMKAGWGIRGIAPLILNLGLIWRFAVNTLPSRFTPGREPRCPLYKTPRGRPGPVWMVVEKRTQLVPARI